MNKTCKYCEYPISIMAHGNRNYCCEECYYHAKLTRNKENYEANNDLLKEFKHIDYILDGLYKIHGPMKYIPAELFNNNGMNWELYSSTISIEDLPVKVIRNYAYCLYNNQTVRIWKIS